MRSKLWSPIWLATPESECSDVFRDKLVAATSRDTVRSRSRTRKPLAPAPLRLDRGVGRAGCA